MSNNASNFETYYLASDLITFAVRLMQAVGLAQNRAQVVAEILLEADLMGHSTHGLQLLTAYLGELEADSMTKEGEPSIIADRGSAVTWDGRYLPGPWLVKQAMDLAFERVQEHPVVTMVIRRSHHIACLAAYPERATEKGLLMLLATSDPSIQTVAPYGGIRPVYTPNPVATGIPTQREPIILDISMSTTANGTVSRFHNQGRQLPGPWMLDNQGNISDNPADLFSEPPGSILPLGGPDLGYKGFALGLLVEALTAALGGYGRADEPKQWGASVFLQVMDPAAFGGSDRFIRETEWLAEACRTSPTKPGEPPVRLPGSRALQLRAEQLKKGVALYPSIMPTLKPWAEKLGIPLPVPLSGVIMR
jgi:LDH2 family malate/lactate/ureidoglycolate dehydrogenase